MDNDDEIKTILDYIDQHPSDNSDLFTLWHEVGHSAFLKAIQEVKGGRIILYHDPEDTGKDDPPIYWRYEPRNRV